MATWMGFEPTTSAVTGRHSNQLNYQAIDTPLRRFEEPPRSGVIKNINSNEDFPKMIIYI